MYAKALIRESDRMKQIFRLDSEGLFFPYARKTCWTTRGKGSRKFGAERKNTYLCIHKHGKVLYGMLPRNPLGLDRSKGTWL